MKAAEERGGVVERSIWSSSEPPAIRLHERRRNEPRGPIAPDDDPEFLRKLDADLRRQKAEEEKNAGNGTGSPAQYEESRGEGRSKDANDELDGTAEQP